jgi:hypothetical protein
MIRYRAEKAPALATELLRREAGAKISRGTLEPSTWTSPQIRGRIVDLDG